MEEQALRNTENLTQDDVLELIGDFPMTPLKNRVIITINTDSEESEDGVKLSSNSLAETQFVMAVGGMVHDLVPGNRVLLNLEKMTETRPAHLNAHEKVPMINLRPLEINGRVYAMIFDGVIDSLDFR